MNRLRYLSIIIIYRRLNIINMELKPVDDQTRLCYISTFSGGGIGDLAIDYGSEIPMIAACEKIDERAGLIRHNFRNNEAMEVFRDIHEKKGDIIQHCRDLLDDRYPWLFVMSPPCQGMSANGAGKIRDSIKKGIRPKNDERNQLILPGIELIEALQPSWFIIENVRRMENTVISNEVNQPENILELLARRLHKLNYTIRSCIIDFKDLGVPHSRERLITIGTNIPELRKKFPRKPNNELFSTELSELHPKLTYGEGRENDHITLRDMIEDMPELDAKTKIKCVEDHLHQIPKWNEKHYYWMDNTDEGQTAFNNDECPHCKVIESSPTSTNCSSCGKDLPRPITEFEAWRCRVCVNQINKKSIDTCVCGITRKNPEIFTHKRIIKGFKTSYRRMKWDLPASTITMNSGVISSDMKGHPTQNRVLSIREIMMLSTLEEHPIETYPWNGIYEFKSLKEHDEKLDNKEEYYDDGKFSAKLARDVIGESIPPLAMYKIVENLKSLDPRL